MTDSTVGRVPALKAVWIEQLRVVGLAIRREAALAALVLALGSVAVIAFSRIPVLQAIVNEEAGDLVFNPGEPPWGFFAAFVALLFPLVVWKGERRFGDTPLWSLPVDHRRHALLKVASGWVWLMAILGAALVCVTITVLASGGTLGIDEVRLLVLATARPLFWAAGLWVAGMGVLGAADIWDIVWIQRAADFVAWYVGGDSFSGGVQLPGGAREAWTLLPTATMWVASSVIWIGLGLAGVLAASGRARND